MNDIRKEELNIERIEELENEIEVIENQISELYRNRDDEIEFGSRDSLTWYRENIKPLSERKDYIERLIVRIKRFNVKVGDGVTIVLYSDQHACTVISRTAKSITVQQDKAILDPNFKPEIIPGGFAGHCVNQEEQTYTYEPNPNGRISTYRWSDKYGQFRSTGDQSIKIINGRYEYYDYNF